MSRWPTVRLGEIAADQDSAISIGPFGSRMKAHNYVSSGVKVIRGQNISDDGRLAGDYVYVSEEFAVTLGTSRLAAGDIVLPHRGAIGRAAIVPDGDFVMSTSLMRIRIDRHQAVPEFVTAFLCSEIGRREILKFASTVGTPGIGQPLSSLRQISMPLPPLDEQRRIAGALGALDDLIDANRSIADKCAELAVQIAATSGDRVVLDEIAIMAKPVQFSPSGRVDHYSIPAFDQARLPERIDGAAIKSGKQRLTDPTVLVSRLNPQTQRVWMAYPSDVAAGASTEFVPLHARDQVTIEEVWAVCAADAFGRQMRAHTTGTTGSHQRVDKAAIPTLLVPDVRALDDNKQAMIVSLVREAHASLAAASELAAARDELLPLLLSGQVRVDEVAG